MKSFLTVIFLVFTFTHFVKGQSVVEDSLSKAREFAYAGKYKDAKKVIEPIVMLHPGNSDAQLLLGLVNAWNGDFEVARSIFKNLIEKNDSISHEPYEALARLEIWDEHPEQALEVCEKGLAFYPDNEALLYIKAKALAQLEETENAIGVLNDLLTQNPDHAEGNKLLEELQLAQLKNAVLVSYAYSQFSNTFSPWHLTSVGYRRKTKFGPVIGRLNHGYIFDRSALQAELDAYPKINRKTYAYLNLGISDGNVFPNFRFGTELYRLLPKGFEVSLGIRGLYFDPVNVYIYTAQVGKYYSNYWLSLRGYMSVMEGQQNFTGHFVARRYLTNRDHYFSMYLTQGTTPLKIVSLAEIQRLQSSAIGLDYQYPLLKRTLLLRLYAEYQYEEYSEVRRTDRYTLSLHLEKRF